MKLTIVHVKTGFFVSFVWVDIIKGKMIGFMPKETVALLHRVAKSNNHYLQIVRKTVCFV